MCQMVIGHGRLALLELGAFSMQRSCHALSHDPSRSAFLGCWVSPDRNLIVADPFLRLLGATWSECWVIQERIPATASSSLPPTLEDRVCQHPLVFALQLSLPNALLLCIQTTATDCYVTLFLGQSCSF